MAPSKRMLYKSLEHAAFKAWPSYEQFEEQGIVYRLSNGYTKRANCANVLENAFDDYPAAIRKVEKIFHTKNLATVIRTLSFCPVPALENCLINKQYSFNSKSLVLGKALSPQGVQITLADEVELKTKAIGHWFEDFCVLNNQQATQQTAHLEILMRIKDETRPLVLCVNGEVVACALGVVHDGKLGVFDVYTKSKARGKGYAGLLLNKLVAWAISLGATYSYLQVLGSNVIAISTYEKLGYRHCYDYGYWVKK